MCKFHWTLVTNVTRGRLFRLWKEDRNSQACHEAINDARAAGWRVPHAV